MLRFCTSLALLAALVACGRNITESDIKLAGVGLNPDEIGPEPELYGGYVEYDWVNFAGGGLALATLGLSAYDEVGPNLVGFVPPYAAIYGLAFIFDQKVPAPDAHHGTIGVPPAAEDACWTNFEPFSFLMASTVEVGDSFVFRDTNADTYFALGRYPEIYPPDPQDVFVYYIGVESWLQQAQTHYAPDGSGGLTEQVLRPVNFRHGAEVGFHFAGGVPPVEAPVSAIPRPSDSMGEQLFNLPTRAEALRLSWNGPNFDGNGVEVGEGAWTTCVSYLGQPIEAGTLSDEEIIARCQAPASTPTVEDFRGQIYTGPWDTTASDSLPAGVTFNWVPGSAEGETVALNVRFLGPVDRTADAFQEGKIPVEAPGDVRDAWQSDKGRDLVDGDLPQGYRDPLACDDPADVQWIFNPALERADGESVLSMRGDPSFNLVEVSCRLADDGDFTLTPEHLATALEYANRKGAEGALFYFSRSTELDATVPAVRDQAGFKQDITPIKIRSHSVEIGRFWIDGSLE